MRGISGLSRLIRDYVEDRDGRIGWLPNLWLFLDNAGRAKRCMRGHIPFEASKDSEGREYSMFRIRGTHCPHPDKWGGQYVRTEPAVRRAAFFSVPARECKACEFHEPAKQFGRRRYACCRWFRENNDMVHPFQILQEATGKAKEMLGQ